MSIPSWVKVGAKCVCVNNSPHKTNGAKILTKGGIYSIRSLEDCGGYGVGIMLVEITNRPVRYVSGFSEPVYRWDRFRPLISQSDDIAMFKALIAPTPQLVVRPDLATTGSGLPS